MMEKVSLYKFTHIVLLKNKNHAQKTKSCLVKKKKQSTTPQPQKIKRNKGGKKRASSQKNKRSTQGENTQAPPSFSPSPSHPNALQKVLSSKIFFPIIPKIHSTKHTLIKKFFDIMSI